MADVTLDAQGGVQGTAAGRLQKSSAAQDWLDALEK